MAGGCRCALEIGLECAGGFAEGCEVEVKDADPALQGGACRCSDQLQED